MTDFELLELQAAALFRHDEQGRITYVNEPGGDRAPRFFLSRSATGNCPRVRDDLAPDTAATLLAAAAEEPIRSEFGLEPEQADRSLEILGVDRANAEIASGPAYRFPEDLPPLDPAPRIVAITPENGVLLTALGWASSAEPAEFAQREPFLAVIDGEQAITACFSSRLTDRVAEAGLDVLPKYRGRGLGPAVTLAWAHAVRASGRIPLYSTSWENAASRRVAAKLGLIQYGVDWQVR